MGTFEIASKTIDLNLFIDGVSPVHRVRRQFIRIGIINNSTPRKIEMQKDSDGQMIVTPSQLNGLWMKQQSFRQCIEKFKWNYILEEEEDNKKDDNNEDQEDEDEEDDNNSNVDDKGDTSSPLPTTSNKKQKYNNSMIKSKSDMAESYPHLS